MISRSGKYCTKEELKEIKTQWDSACNTPVITFSTGEPDMASVARRGVMESIDTLAIAHGLDSRSKFWGMDLVTGEFVYDEEK